MKAWEFNGFGLEQLKLVEKSVPKPAGNELLVHVSAVSLNYRDKLLYDGLHNPDLRFPMIPVADAAGEVVEVGRDVTRFSAGDRIISHYATPRSSDADARSLQSFGRSAASHLGCPWSN